MSLALWEAMIDVHQEPLIGCDDQGRVVTMNGRAEEMVGCLRKEAAGASVEELLANDLGDKAARGAALGGVTDRELTESGIIGADGKRYRLASSDVVEQLDRGRVLRFKECSQTSREGLGEKFSTSAMDNPSTMTLTLTARDLVDDERQREELRQWKERFDQLTRRSRTVVWEVNPGGGFTYVSGAAREVFGYDPEEMVRSMGLDDLHEQASFYELERFLGQAYARNEAFEELQWKAITSDGRCLCTKVDLIPLLDERGRLTGYRGSHRDITEQYMAQQRVADYEALLLEVSLVTKEFINTPRWSQTLRQIFPGLGEQARASRVYFFKVWADKEGTWMASQTHEWCAPGIEPQLGNPELENIPLVEAGYGRWVEQMRAGHQIAGHVREFPRQEQEVLKAQGIQSLVVSPVFAGEDWVGFLGFDQCDGQRYWDQGEREVLAIVCDGLGAVIRRRKTEKVLEEARRREVQTGAEIQEKLLQGNIPTNLTGLQVSADSSPSRQVDGDFFELYTMGPMVVDLVLGDVMGKGIPAALIAAATKKQLLYELRGSTPARSVRHSPQEVVTRLDRALAGRLRSIDSFVTLGFYRFELARKKLVLVDCGHTAVIQVPQKGEPAVLKGDNLPLGVLRGECYEQREVALAPEDVFFFYSDGIIEARNQQGEQFGVERLVAAVRAYRREAAATIVARVQQQLYRFLGSEEKRLEDDATCVCIKVDRHVGRQRLVVDSALEKLATVRGFVAQSCDALAPQILDESWIHRLTLAVNEAFSNIVLHGCQGGPGEAVEVIMELVADQMVVDMRYRGQSWCPSSVQAPSFDGTREGGFGIFLIQESVDRLTYRVGDDGRQWTRLEKALSDSDQ